ncbi:MAG: hypothetical protein IPJ65_11055 [Archangiaceae bacterium]|nr:hypothetical protein [Archangiaceae bacterium]
MNTSPPATTSRPNLGESELTLSGVLQVSIGRETTHLPLTEALQLSLEVVRLVAKTHDQGKVVGVLDAAHLVCSTTTGSLALGGKGGNPIAPELKRGEMPDRLTDVYALGALMYRLLTGSKVDPSRLIPPPSHSNPAVDTALDELVLCALDEDPSERPYSARDLEQRLLAIYEELGLEDSRTEATALITKARPRKPAAAPAPAPKKAPPAPAPKPRFARPEATVDHDEEEAEDDDAYHPQLDKNPLDKRWLMGGLAVLALFLVAFFAWPQSKHDTARADTDDEVPAQKARASSKYTLAPPPPSQPVKAQLVDNGTDAPKKSTRRARR